MSSQNLSLEGILQVLQIRSINIQTRQAYQDWIYRFFFFHELKSSERIGASEVSAFLLFLAKEKKVSCSSQRQAKQALVFLFKEILHRPLPTLNFSFCLETKSPLLILSRDEVAQILMHLKDEAKLMVGLLYGCGLRLGECLSLRIRNLNLKRGLIHICRSAGKEDHTTIIPVQLKKALEKQIAIVKLGYKSNMLRSFPGVNVPAAIETKIPDAPWKLSWQYLFPSQKTGIDPLSGKVRVQHLSKSYLQKAIKQTVSLSGMDTAINCRTFRHSFAVHLLEDGYDLKILQQLLGHKTIQSTKTYLQVAKQDPFRVRSPLDSLASVF